MQNNVVNVINL